MKNLFGSPGKVSGLVLRIGQCLFAAASIGVMASASGFSTATAFCYLIASMGLQVTAFLSLAGACSSAGVVVALTRDTNFCQINKRLVCSMFKTSVALAFISWFFLAITSYIMFWLLASI